MAAGDGMGPMAMEAPRGDHAPTGAGKAAAPAGHASIMQMTFFWGDRAVVLFPGWPGARGAGAYVLCLLFVLALAALTEALAAVSSWVARRGVGSRASSAALLTAAHAVRMGMAYLVMLAVMSFNGGVLLAAVAGHALGFLLARSRVHPGAVHGGGAAARDRELGGMAIPPSDGP
ncbi:copper transporter 6-like [Phragmites australis]|uniref:copper transporter 6-like n=1 Tax=Phragmites australis TaxID=29695 RepID=UPI002D78F763|nr:copper transporter 6-like [Phragmites australis]XP_062185463.1 copper transporter 6-like [Phragmites australis]